MHECNEGWMDGRKGRRNGWSKNVKKVNKPRKKKKKTTTKHVNRFTFTDENSLPKTRRGKKPTRN